jgi:AcrR family transcriptional regulator
MNHPVTNVDFAHEYDLSFRFVDPRRPGSVLTPIATQKPAATTERPRKDTAVRRKPSQSRSRKSVAKCLKAAQELLERDGIDGVTTKRIAHVAGLSVGTVYGYFPNKEAIIYQLGASWMETIRMALIALNPRRSGIPDAFTYFDRVVEVGIREYGSTTGLGTVINMLSAIPELREVERTHDRAVVDAFAAAFAHFYPNAEPKELQSLSRSIFSMTHAALSQAIVYKTNDRQLALRNLMIAAYSLIVHTAAQVRDSNR